MDINRQNEVMRIMDLVRTGRSRTRSDIARALSMRSTSVSEIVGDLISRSLLTEMQLKPKGRGRPVGMLNFNPRRLGAILLSVEGRSLVGQIVDLGFDVLSEARIVPPPDADNIAMVCCFRSLIQQLVSTFPPGIDIGCLVASLPGLLDVPRGTWCVSSRWPKMVNLDVLAVLSDFPWPVSLVRNLDAELYGLHLADDARADDNILLLHWGHGIGAAYCSGGEVINRKRGRFCEIGHWSLGNRRNVLCTCGNRDCLETVAAFWAIGDRLRSRFPELPKDERGLADSLRRVDILDSVVMTEALAEVLRLTANLCRLLFPDRIVLTGPFSQHPEVFRRFVDTIGDATLLTSIDKIRVTASDPERRFEISGALQGPLDAALRACLCGPCDGFTANRPRKLRSNKASAAQIP